MVKHTGLRFEDAANEIVKDLTAEELGSVSPGPYLNTGKRSLVMNR
jgi:hypothetical protein